MTITERSPRLAVQGTEHHRHFRYDGGGYLDHAHAIGSRDHEHLEQRLSHVRMPYYPTPAGESYLVLFVAGVGMLLVLWLAWWAIA